MWNIVFSSFSFCSLVKFPCSDYKVNSSVFLRTFLVICYLNLASYISQETSLLYLCSGRELNFCEMENMSLLVTLCCTTEYQSWWLNKDFYFLSLFCRLGVKIKMPAWFPKTSLLDLWLTPSPLSHHSFPFLCVCILGTKAVSTVFVLI